MTRARDSRQETVMGKATDTAEYGSEKMINVGQI